MVHEELNRLEKGKAHEATGADDNRQTRLEEICLIFRAA